MKMYLYEVIQRKTGKSLYSSTAELDISNILDVKCAILSEVEKTLKYTPTLKAKLKGLDWYIDCVLLED